MVNLTNTLTTLCNKIVSFFDDTMSKQSFKNFYSQKTLTHTCTNGSNWTVSSHDVQLQGNLLNLHIKAKASSATGTGAISNQTIASFTIPNTFGAGNFYTTSSITSGTGNVASFFINSTSIDEDNLTFNLQITATHAAIDEISCNFCMLVRFDYDKLLAQL